MLDFVGHEASQKTTTNPVLWVTVTVVPPVVPSSSLMATRHVACVPASQPTRIRLRPIRGW